MQQNQQNMENTAQKSLKETQQLSHNLIQSITQKLDGIQSQQNNQLASLNDNIQQNQRKLNQVASNTARHAKFANRLNTMAQKVDKLMKMISMQTKSIHSEIQTQRREMKQQLE
eukprot:956164_1